MRIESGFKHVTYDDPLKRKILLVVQEIYRRAAGKTCEDCIHYQGSWCSKNGNVAGGPLSIIRSVAPACQKHETT